MIDWIESMFQDHELTRMGHSQRVEDLNLGLGWVYYGLARVIRPSSIVVIGSYRGFVPLVLGKALADNIEDGIVYFIDPSYVDDFWTDPTKVNAHFTGLGLNNVRHFLMTTQQFVETDEYQKLSNIGMVFVDGYHTEEQARFDHEAFRDRLSPDGVVLFHDSAKIRQTRIYGPERAYEHRVKAYMDTLKQDRSFQVFDLPFAAGVTLVRNNDLGNSVK